MPPTANKREAKHIQASLARETNTFEALILWALLAQKKTVVSNINIM